MRVLFAALFLFFSNFIFSQSAWQNWDQARAFEEARARVAAGKDPIPGVRNCFWRFGPFSADPYLNIAYPDAAAVYWGVVFTMPPGAKLHLEGQFAHARYISLISYDVMGAPTDSVADYLLRPMSGNVNPYLPGADRSAKNRTWRIEVMNKERDAPIPWGQYLKGQIVDVVNAPAQANNGQQQIVYRIYGRDQGTDETANGGLPVPVLTLADGRVLRGPDVCAPLRTGQQLVVDPAALAVPLNQLAKLQETARARGGPLAPATLPPTWSKSSEDMSRYAIYTGETTVAPGENRRAGTFYANLDNQYVRTFINRKHGDVFVMRAKAPTTPKTLKGGGTWGEGELRYWSLCSQQGFGTGRVNACLFDEQIPVGRDGFFTVVVSRVADRPRNAMNECGIGWLPVADVGDGTGDPDMSMIVLRHMLGAADFKHAIHGVKSQNTIAQDMGEYFPRGRYTSVAAFETAVPCLIERR
jgi:hypothetical protein